MGYGVSESVRSSKPDDRLKLQWAILSIAAVPFLFNLAFGWGDSLLQSQFDTKSQASHQVRGTVFALSLLRIIGHVIWGVFLCPHALPLGHAVPIALASHITDAGVILATLASRTTFDPIIDTTLLALYLFGQFIERFSEFDRTVFKSKLANAGKPHTTGLFAYVVHANYLGFIIRQAAFLAFTHMWFLPILITIASVLGFISGDIKNQRERNIKKYGDDFKLYWDTTYKLIPGLV